MNWYQVQSSEGESEMLFLHFKGLVVDYLSMGSHKL
jgi:hypothetical protein